MTTWLTENVWMVPLYPLAAFFLIVLIRAFTWNAEDESVRKGTRTLSMLLTIAATLAGLIHTVPLVGALLAGTLERTEFNYPWIQAGAFQLSIGYLVDSMSVMMLLVVTFISLFIQIYTHGYMKHDPGYCKFYAYLALFNFSMLGLVLATNLFQMYIFWELVGVSSYLLIGFWFTKPSAAAAAVKAFLMNRVGDFGLLIGILGLLVFTYGWWQQHADQYVLLSFEGIAALAPEVGLFIPVATLTLISILIFMGPMAKSAQVPLHTWLPDAMEGPTPISALIHAATMVAAGVYLVGRVFPLFEMSSTAMAVIAVIGTITAVIAATIAIVQVDIKKALAYSTCSQLGFMVAAMGCGAFAAGLFHLFTHAFFKAMLFLCSGSVIHACEDEQDMRKMGGLFRKLPVTGATYLIGCVAISGLFWTSGFWSKEEILIGAVDFSPAIFWTLAVTAGLTAFYMFRSFFMTFGGQYRGETHVHREDPVMWVPLAVLAVPSLAIGYLLTGTDLLGVHIPAFGDMIVPPGVEGGAHHAAEHHAAAGALSHEAIALISMALGYGGAVLAWLMYAGPLKALPERVRRMASPLYIFFTRKWYFDELYGAFVRRVYLVFAEGSAAFDKGIIDGLVNFTGHSVMGTGAALRQLQTGRAQTYVAVIFFGVVVLSLLLIYWQL